MQNDKNLVFKNICNGLNEIKKTNYNQEEIMKLTFPELMIDSLEFIQLVVFLESKCGYSINDDLLAYSDWSVDDFVNHIIEENLQII